jgi:histidinol dehydrogenase
MQLNINPPAAQWPELARRPALPQADLEGRVRDVLDTVRNGGDEALRQYTARFDRWEGAHPEVPSGEWAAQASLTPEPLQDAVRLAIANLSAFHAAQREGEIRVETMPGVTCWRRSVPLERVGLYIPGGSAPLFSTLLMLAVPARLAGCKEVILCTPPDAQGRIHPAILFAARETGVHRVFRAGGAQAVAAMAYGTESIPKVDKILGPGNQYVTMAKQLVSQQGAAIDLPAGPSELLVIADASAHPAFVAADLLSQAEHGPDSQVILLSDSEALVAAVQAELERQLPLLPRAEIAAAALANSRAVVLPGRELLMAFSNAYAPEHLILAVEDPAGWAQLVEHAGSVFLGHYAPESAGDYASGTNHTLPTNGYARAYSGVSLDQFVRKITFQQLTPDGLRNVGPAVMEMAAAEGLEAHRQAVALRLDALNA